MEVDRCQIMGLAFNRYCLQVDSTINNDLKFTFSANPIGYCLIFSIRPRSTLPGNPRTEHTRVNIITRFAVSIQKSAQR